MMSSLSLTRNFALLFTLHVLSTCTAEHFWQVPMVSSSMLGFTLPLQTYIRTRYVCIPATAVCSCIGGLPYSLYNWLRFSDQWKARPLQCAAVLVASRIPCTTGSDSVISGRPDHCSVQLYWWPPVFPVQLAQIL